MNRSLKTLLPLAMAAALGCSSPPEPAAPNVLLISVDTLRLDRLTSYGGPEGNSPRLDALAGEGVRFASVQSVRGLTWPSLTTLQTGQHPRSHQVRRNGAMLDEAVVTLPERLARAGWETGAFLSNMCDAPNRGFDTFFCSWWEEDGPPAMRQRRQWASHDQPKWDAAITRQAIEFVKAPRQRPFFAWVHYIDPHKPYDPVPEYLRDEFDGSLALDDASLAGITLSGRSLTAAERTQLMAVYDSQVAATDAHIGRLLQGLAEAGLDNSTVVIFTADHGEELGDHRSYFYHLSSVYQQVLAVPLILRWPGHLPAGRVVTEPISAVDIAPTLMHLLGQPPPAEMEGVSRLRLARGDAEAGGAETTFAEWSDQVLVVGQGDWRYIWNPGEIVTYGAPFSPDAGKGFVIEREELYDLAADPLQQKNVVGEHAELAAALRQRACAFATEKPFSRQAPRPIPADVQERLESLGYLQGEEDEEPSGTSLADHCPAAP